MKKAGLICFTKQGELLSKKVSDYFIEMGYEIESVCFGGHKKLDGVKSSGISLQEWAKQQFQQSDVIVFIGATGIAVRAIAPCLKDKKEDPAVLVMDERARFVIPLLSGHIGGANDFAKEMARRFDSIPIITTATDINYKFAVDVFAKKNDLFITDMKLAKQISAALLREENVGFLNEFERKGDLPKQLVEGTDNKLGISISLRETKKPFFDTLTLIPKIITLGIGCKKGKSSEEIEAFVLDVLSDLDISIHSIHQVASIDLKKEEEGLRLFCKAYNLAFKTYSKEVLESVPGDFSESSYVKQITGVGNVCERAAVMGSNYGTLIQRKVAKNGITVSIAKKEKVIYFE